MLPHAYHLLLYVVYMCTFKKTANVLLPLTSPRLCLQIRCFWSCTKSCTIDTCMPACR